MATRRPAFNETNRNTNVARRQACAKPPIEFIPNEEFDRVEELKVLQIPAGTTLYSDRDDAGMAEVTSVGDYDGMHALPLLSVVGEAFLFRKMNFLKFRAFQLSEADDCKTITPVAMREVQDLLSDAEVVRNHIAECNLRLVISIARKFATSQSEFDELVSEGNMIMLKAIDKFDFSRGFRFSTYATHSVQRHFYRLSKQKNRRGSVEMESSVELINAFPAAEIEPADSYAQQEERRSEEFVARIDECLDEREQLIIRERFGLGPNGISRTLRDVAKDVSLSKERVRQIQMRAIEKLREFFGELQPDLTVT